MSELDSMDLVDADVPPVRIEISCLDRSAMLADVKRKFSIYKGLVHDIKQKIEALAVNTPEGYVKALETIRRIRQCNRASALEMERHVRELEAFVKAVRAAANRVIKKCKEVEALSEQKRAEGENLKRLEEMRLAKEAQPAADE